MIAKKFWLLAWLSREFLGLRSASIELLGAKGIVLHFFWSLRFDHYGKYTGTYNTPKGKNSSQVFITHTAHWLNERKRHELAVAFVISVIGNMFNLIKYYQRRQENINAGEIIDYLKFCLAQVPDTSDINLLIIVYDVKKSWKCPGVISHRFRTAYLKEK